MATSDSRFKPFKFNARSKPPPLPPKDSIYLERNNPSISSIDIQPNSPMSPPLLTTNPSTHHSDRMSTRKDKALAFLKFPKRSPRSPSGSGGGEGSIIVIGNEDIENPPPPEPDSQISTPWNFQHNIHVDEGYIGLPPSWSTSLASAGFTPEEIVDIQARRAAGSLAPDLRYLLTERPTSPMVPGFQPAAPPVLSNPTSRSASLPLTESAQPPISKLATSSSIIRRPPPKRKPPLPTEEHSQNGHQPSQSYSSTAHERSDSHQSNTTASSSHNGQSAVFSGASNSTPHHYLNPSTSTSNLSSHNGHSTTDNDGQTPLARGESADRPRTGDRTISSKPIWGTKRNVMPLIGKLSNQSLSSLASSAKLPSSSSASPLDLQQHLTSSPFAAAAASSLSTLKVAAVNTSLSIATAMRNTKGAIRRGLGTSKDNDDSEDVENPEDEEFVSDVLEIDDTSGAEDDAPAGPGGRKAVWQLYTRPRTSTDTASKSSDVNQHESTNTNNPTEGGGKSHRPYLLSSRSQGSLRSLTRQKPTIKKSDSQVSLNTQGSNSQASVSQASSNSPLAAAASGSGTATGLGTGDVRFIKKHQNSDSVPSLASIPEVDVSPGISLHPYAFSSAASSSFVAVPQKPKPSVTPVPAISAPRLALLHQSKGSLDLSRWSEALLSGISRSAELDLAFTFSEDEKETAKGRKEKDDDSGDSEGVTENEMDRKETANEDEKERGSPLATARPLGHPTQMNQNVSAIATGTSHGQQLIPTKPRYPAPSRPIPPINNNNASSTSIPLTEKPLYSTGRSRSNSRSKPGSTGISIAPPPPLPLPAVLSPFSPLTNGLVAPHPHHHHVYGQSPRPPPAAPLPPPPPSAISNVPPTTNNTNNSNTAAASAVMALHGILSPPPTAASMLSPPPSAYQHSLKSLSSTTSPDSAQLWSEIETMMNPGLMQSMGVLTGAEGAGEVVLGPPPSGVKGSVKTPGGAGGGSQGQSQAQSSHIESAGPELDAGITAIVDDLIATSPTPSTALTESFSPILPFSPEEERMATTRVLRAGEGVLGTKTHNHGGERNGEGREGNDGSDHSDQEEELVHISKPPGPTNRQDNNAREALSERDQAYRDSSRSSSSTLTAEAVAVATTVVRKVSIARRAGAVVLKGGDPTLLAPAPASYSNGGIRSPVSTESKQHPPSPLSSNFGNSSEESAGSLSNSLSPSSPSQDNYPTPATDSGSLASPLMYYLDGTQTPSPLKMAFGALPSLPSGVPTTLTPRTKAQNEGGVNNYDYNYSPGVDDGEDGVPFAYPDEATVEAAHASMAATTAVPALRPTIIISDEPHSAAIPTTAATSLGTAPLSPFQQYRGWLSAVVAPLEEFIDEGVDPRDHYLDLKEIAEGESGSVFSARLNPQTASKLSLPPAIKTKDMEEMSQHPEEVKLVAIKSVAIVPSGSPKLVDLQRELTLMKGLVGHENVLGMDGVYVDLAEDSLWVRMELMERSLADMVGLVGDGLMLQDRMLARFAGDVLSALEYLQKHSIAHRDVRSDNLLLNKHGILKLADFSNAVQVTKNSPMRPDPAGVVYWQAPEVRKPPYNVLKVDVWSLGATVWEMAQTEPPFSDTQQFADRWPPLRQPELYSPAFHDFLRKCSEPASSRPNASDLLKHPFVHNACGRPVIIHLLSQCMAIEQSLQEGVDVPP